MYDIEKLKRELKNLQDDFENFQFSTSKKLGFALNGVDSSKLINSLEAASNNFHWLTLFESLDGHAVTEGGDSAAVLAGPYLGITSGTTLNDELTIEKFMTYFSTDDFNWGKKRKLRTTINFTSTGSVTFLIISGGGTYASNEEKIGFLLSNTTLYGITADGTSKNTVELVTVAATNTKTLEAIFYPGDRCEFYVNGVLMGTSRSNLPSGSSHANKPLKIYALSTANADAAENRISYWEFWQEY